MQTLNCSRYKEVTNKMIGNFNSTSAIGDMFSYFSHFLFFAVRIFKWVPVGNMDGSGIWWLVVFRVDQMRAFAESERNRIKINWSQRSVGVAHHQQIIGVLVQFGTQVNRTFL